MRIGRKELVKRVFLLSFAILCLVLITGCLTLGTQEMGYLGDETRDNDRVVGKSTHIDFAGFGVDADTYAANYEVAINDAFSKAPDRINRLKDVKAFKEYNHLPQVAGYGLIATGAMVAANPKTSPAFGIILSVCGYALSLINMYDFVVIATPERTGFSF